MSETLTLVKELNIDEFNYYIDQIINSPVDFCRGDIDKTFYIEEIKEAQSILEERKTTGSVFFKF